MKGKGGILALSENSSLIIMKSTFRNNAADSGSFLYSVENNLKFSDSNPIIIGDSTIENPIGNETVFEISHSFLILINIKILNSRINIFQLISSYLLLYNISLSNISWLKSGFACIITSENSFIFSYKLKVSEISLALPALDIHDSHLNMIQSEFSQIYCSEESSVIVSSGSYFFFMNNSFTRYPLPVFKLENCSAFFIRCTFYNNEKGYLGLFLTNEKFIGGSVLDVQNAELLFVSDSNFSLNKLAAHGGVIKIIGNLKAENSLGPKLFIFNCRFYNNSAKFEGGVIYIEEEFGEMINNIFEFNSATNGAAIYFYVKEGFNPFL